MYFYHINFAIAYLSNKSLNYIIYDRLVLLYGNAGLPEQSF
jgi:hypothetical protein